MVKVILGDLLENKVGRMRRERSSTFSEKGDTPMVCIGRKVKIVVVVIVEETIFSTIVINVTRSLGCVTLWPIHTNR